MIRFLQTPGRAKKFILGAMLLFICVALVLSLGVGGMSPDAITRAGVIAEVGDEKITIQELQQQVQFQVQRMMPQRRGLTREPMAAFSPHPPQKKIFQKINLLETH